MGQRDRGLDSPDRVGSENNTALLGDPQRYRLRAALIAQPLFPAEFSLINN
jgi:hypothetical protein